VKRIVVIGTTGSGKTTFAAALAARLGCPHIELDALHFGPNWTEAPLERFREQVSDAILADCWVMDGNYSRKVGDLTWARATTILWLDYPLWLTLYRLFLRTLRRVFLRQTLWAGNRESFREQFLSKDSLFWWALTTHEERRARFDSWIARPDYAHLSVMRFRQPDQAAAWLESVSHRP
jgi:adenylate kinase family enzyme